MVPSSCPLVGNSFIEDGSSWLRTIHRKQETTSFNENVVLKRNPANEHDSNAIEVWWREPISIKATNSTNYLAHKLGHLPKEVAAELAPLLDRGDKYQAEMYVRLDPEHPEHPGATIYLFKMVYI